MRIGQQFDGWIAVAAQGQDRNATCLVVCNVCGREKFVSAGALRSSREMRCKCQGQRLPEDSPAPAPPAAVPISEGEAKPVVKKVVMKRKHRPGK
jgi:hypothetical protein